MRALIVLLGALVCGACMQEAVRFQARPEQQALVRDGHPALISQKPSSLVMIRGAQRQFPSGERPMFVVGIRNLTKTPLEFRVNDIAVTQARGADATPMKVFSYEELVAEEKTQQVIDALLIGAAAGASTALAAQAGYRNKTTTVTGPDGSYSYQTTTYNPSRAVAAQDRATRQNQRLINAGAREGRSNLAALEREVIKDNTLLAGEWYGGMLVVQAPPRAANASGPRHYVIGLSVGVDRHEIEVVQEDVK